MNRPETQSRYMKVRRAEAKAEGFCQKCFKRLAMPGPSGPQALCGWCADQRDEYRDRLRSAS